MAKKHKSTTTKRFGPRYGITGKEKVARIEAEMRKLHKCPYCAQEKVRRLVMGVWECKKCLAKFTGKAYTTVKQKGELI